MTTLKQKTNRTNATWQIFGVVPYFLGPFKFGLVLVPLPEANIAPENGWLED